MLAIALDYYTSVSHNRVSLCGAGLQLGHKKAASKLPEYLCIAIFQREEEEVDEEQT